MPLSCLICASDVFYMASRYKTGFTKENIKWFVFEYEYQEPIIIQVVHNNL